MFKRRTARVCYFCEHIDISFRGKHENSSCRHGFCIFAALLCISLFTGCSSTSQQVSPAEYGRKAGERYGADWRAAHPGGEWPPIEEAGNYCPDTIDAAKQKYGWNESQVAEAFAACVDGITSKL